MEPGTPDDVVAGHGQVKAERCVNQVAPFLAIERALPDNDKATTTACGYS